MHLWKINATSEQHLLSPPTPPLHCPDHISDNEIMGIQSGCVLQGTVGYNWLITASSMGMVVGCGLRHGSSSCGEILKITINYDVGLNELTYLN